MRKEYRFPVCCMSMVSMALLPMVFIASVYGQDTVTAGNQQTGQQKTYELDPVTVIATKTPKKLLDAPGSVSMIRWSTLRFVIGDRHHWLTRCFLKLA